MPIIIPPSKAIFQVLELSPEYRFDKWLHTILLFSTIFQLYRGVSLIDGRNRRKQPTCRKSLTNFITICCIEHTLSWAGFELTTLLVIGTDCIGSCKSNYWTITKDPKQGTKTKYSTIDFPSTKNANFLKSPSHLSKLADYKVTVWNKINRIGGVMTSVLASSAVDREFEPRSGQTKDYKIGICWFSAKHAALRGKSKDWLARNQNNVSEWSDMSTRGLLFQGASTIKIQLSVLV